MDSEEKRERDRRAKKKYRANMSPEKKAAFAAKWEAYRRNQSQEKKDARNAKRRESYVKSADLSEAERERKREQGRKEMSKHRAKLSPEQKKAIYNKRREKLDEVRAYAREWAKRKYANNEEWRKQQIQKSRERNAANKHRVNEARKQHWQSMTPDERHHIGTLRRHRLNAEQYADMLAAQKGTCAICRNPNDNGRKNAPRLYVDHCHNTRKIRGLLCNRCNIGLARFKDDPDLLRRAAAYLERDR